LLLGFGPQAFVERKLCAPDGMRIEIDWHHEETK
jgi:hypothetical protein